MPKLPSALLRSTAATCIALLFAGGATASDYQDVPQVNALISEMTTEHGFAEEQLNTVFSAAVRKQAILDAISRPAEKTKPWKEYRPIFLNNSRIINGVSFWKKHAEALARAEKEYGVPAQTIVAIIGVETLYGGNTGSWKVIDALSTLCFDYPPRAVFFCQQLKEYLLLTRQEQLDPLVLKGSYAGAMGLPQFMPSSFRAYAVDFDNDGHIDIWNNPTDAIGSVANYFKQHGWTQGGEVVSRATVTGDKVAEGLTVGIDPQLTMGQLQALGWNSSSAVPDDLKVTAFRFDGAEGEEYWLGLPNFYAITRYNRSPMYAMAVYQLSEAILQAKGTP